MTQVNSLTDRIRISGRRYGTWVRAVAPKEELRMMARYGLLSSVNRDTMAEDLIYNSTEVYFGDLGLVGFAARIGQLGNAEVEVARLNETHRVRADLDEEFEPINACLPPMLPPLRGGTPLQKLQRLHAFAMASPEVSEAIRITLSYALGMMEAKSGALSPRLAAHSMIAATKPGLTKPGRVNLMQALDVDHARLLMKRLMLRETDPSDVL